MSRAAIRRVRPSIAGLLAILALAVACGGDADSGAGATVPLTDATSADMTLIGSWHRAQTCEEMLAAFQQAGLAVSHAGWLQGNFFGGEPGPSVGDVCEGALGPLEHDHFFTAAGAFGSHDQNGEEVDHGDFEVVDEDTVVFPSHAAEFGYDGDIVVGYTVSGDVATFEVSLPEGCVDACADAYAWALSAFASGPWDRGEVISGSTGASTAPTMASSVPDVLASPTIEGLFEVDDKGRRLNLVCWGEGSPTVVLEAGHPDGAGVIDFGRSGAEFTRVLAAQTRVCAYDRAGWGGSDPAPNEPRTADDVIGDLHALLGAAGVEEPYVLVGSSFGGMVVTYYAATHPDEVVGVVLLDVPAPDDTLTAAEIPEIAWDHPSNLEHVDAGPEFESRFANHPVSFPAPLTVVTAPGGLLRRGGPGGMARRQPRCPPDRARRGTRDLPRRPRRCRRRGAGVGAPPGLTGRARSGPSVPEPHVHRRDPPVMLLEVEKPLCLIPAPNQTERDCEHGNRRGALSGTRTQRARDDQRRPGSLR